MRPTFDTVINVPASVIRRIEVVQKCVIYAKLQVNLSKKLIGYAIFHELPVRHCNNSGAVLR